MPQNDDINNRIIDLLNITKSEQDVDLVDDTEKSLKELENYQQYIVSLKNLLKGMDWGINDNLFDLLENYPLVDLIIYLMHIIQGHYECEMICIDENAAGRLVLHENILSKEYADLANSAPVYIIAEHGGIATINIIGSKQRMITAYNKIKDWFWENDFQEYLLQSQPVIVMLQPSTSKASIKQSHVVMIGVDKNRLM